MGIQIAMTLRESVKRLCRHREEALWAAITYATSLGGGRPRFGHERCGEYMRVLREHPGAPALLKEMSEQRSVRFISAVCHMLNHGIPDIQASASTLEGIADALEAQAVRNAFARVRFGMVVNPRWPREEVSLGPAAPTPRKRRRVFDD